MPKKLKDRTKKRAKTGSRPAEPVAAYNNTWTDVTPSKEAEIISAESALGVRFPRPLKDLLISCAGGYPEKNCHPGTSRRAEVCIGYVLPVTDQRRTDGIVKTTLNYRSDQGLPTSLLPFAYDTGNANLICIRFPAQDIIYWLHDERDERNRTVRLAPSLDSFLSNLTEAPF